jgi:hypothetical protein
VYQTKPENAGEYAVIVKSSSGDEVSSTKVYDGVRVETQPNGNISLSIESALPSDSDKYELMLKTPTDVLNPK